MKKRKTAKPEIEDHFGELDIHNLHKEWVRQDKLVGYYGRQLAIARRRHEELKASTQVYEAETSRRIRQKPVVYGIKRPTEAAIKEAVLIEVLASKEHDRLIYAKYKVEMLEVAMRRLEHRKKAISDLVYLRGQEYFAEPKIPKDSKMRDRVDRAREERIRGLRDE
jgi:hypothetical protein